MAKKQAFYITTAISYPNGVPHIGHAYEAIATDALARFKRLDGYEVFFLTGTDEHGLKMLQTARHENLSARELADKNTPRFQQMVERLNCSHDDFIRTTEPRHHQAAQEIWRRMEGAGDIYLDHYSGWYSVRDEAYYDESELQERDGGGKLSPQGTPVDWVEEETYFFRLSSYQEKLLAHYSTHPTFIGPQERRNEVISFVKRGLKDLSISRTTFDWGVKVPGNDKHVMYVWVDALTNYLTGIGFPEAGDPKWHHWPANLHIIGKDILRFHSVYWPAFLLSAGLSLPERIYAHGFLFNRGEKMSKSLGNVVDPFSLIDHYGVDPVRYFFLREVPFGKDGNYSHDAIVNRINADLANDLGNLAQRSLSMVSKNCDQQIPSSGDLTGADKILLEAADSMADRARQAIEIQAIHKALEAIWTVVAQTNRYFTKEEPWALKKSDPQRMQTVLYVTLEAIRQIAILAQPFIPTAAEKLLDQTGVLKERRAFQHLGEKGRLLSGVKLPKPEPVFPRYVEEE